VFSFSFACIALAIFIFYFQYNICYATNSTSLVQVHNGPWYVCGKNVKENILIVTNRQDVPDHRYFDPKDSNAEELQDRTFDVFDVTWMSIPPIFPSPIRSFNLLHAEKGIRLTVQIRHGPDWSAATVYLLEDNNLRVILDKPDHVKYNPPHLPWPYFFHPLTFCYLNDFFFDSIVSFLAVRQLHLVSMQLSMTAPHVLVLV
jgi:hypothetical protein